ncbi:hypothetical protein BpHYR1_033700 [Brachionus plicatilis]|uniref:Uncharacterized protein n=1 Tax=Brachionus plicatilis TaxID=10195 RepID=A0A3M7SKA0_BRAPC|nr:hypothetical protein BpHYR1_033700 [Brachionus plicatilis]
MTTLDFARSTGTIYAPMIGNKVNITVENLLKTTYAFMFLALHNRKTKKPKALFYQNDCDLNSSENESDFKQAVFEQEPPSDSVIEKAHVAEATVEDTVKATVDLPGKRGRQKKSTTLLKKSRKN